MQYSTNPTKDDSATKQALINNANKVSFGASNGGDTNNSTERETVTNGNETPRNSFGASGKVPSSGNDGGFGKYRGGVGDALASSKGLMHNQGKTHVYDQNVSEAFICGFSSIGEGTVSVMRNGYSYTRMLATENKVFSNVDGMILVSGDSVTQTDIDSNSYKDATQNYCIATSNAMEGLVTMCVWLERNDVVEVMAVQRDYLGSKYTWNATVNLEIVAITNRSYAALRNDQDFGYYSPTEWPQLLNLFEWQSNEQEIASWVQSIITAFNLTMTQDGNFVEFNTNRGVKKDLNFAVNLDDRVSSDEAEAKNIQYPSKMAVKYTIDTEEWGFEKTVDENHINGDDWKEYGDSGYTVIDMSNDSTTSLSSAITQTDFSYNYYDEFCYRLNDREVWLEIPVIEKAEYMADGYGYEEAMKHDGMSFTQRFFFRKDPTDLGVETSDYNHETVYISVPCNMRNGVNLSYKYEEKSLLTEYFNFVPMLWSNYVIISAYLSPQEYHALKCGAMVRFDDDLYYVSEIEGYDPSGNNTTKLTLIKR